MELCPESRKDIASHAYGSEKSSEGISSKNEMSSSYSQKEYPGAALSSSLIKELSFWTGTSGTPS
jgi:hypothetical protein